MTKIDFVYVAVAYQSNIIINKCYTIVSIISC